MTSGNHLFDRKYGFSKDLTIEEVRKHIHNIFQAEAYRQSYKKKTTIFQYNDPADEAYMVESGRLRTFQITPEGKEVTFQIINPGESIGIAEVFLNIGRMRYAETMSKTSLLIMSKERLFNLFYTNDEFCLKVLWILTQQILRYQNIIEDLAVLPVRDRVIKLIIRLCKERGKQTDNYTVIDFPITHEEIAQMVGSSRQTVTFILNDLRKEGIVSWEQKKVKILRWMDLIDQSS